MGEGGNFYPITLAAKVAHFNLNSVSLDGCMLTMMCFRKGSGTATTRRAASQNDRFGFRPDCLCGSVVWRLFENGKQVFAIPWQALQVDPVNKQFILNASKDALENATGFDKDKLA